jgi:hypothetical protein
MSTGMRRGEENASAGGASAAGLFRHMGDDEGRRRLVGLDQPAEAPVVRLAELLRRQLDDQAARSIVALQGGLHVLSVRIIHHEHNRGLTRREHVMHAGHVG